VLNDYTLANDLDRQFGDVAIGLGKMLFLSTIQSIFVGGFMFGFVRLVAKAFIGSGETRPPNIAGS
jgi:hypothetical protein